MHSSKYLYTFTYDIYESDLCKLESRYIFNKEEEDKLLLSNKKIDPSCSAFIKQRLEITLSNDDYDSLLTSIKEEKITIEGFKAEYLLLDGDPTRNAERLGKLKDIGYSIEGVPDYYKPTVVYALCY